MFLPLWIYVICFWLLLLIFYFSFFIFYFSVFVITIFSALSFLRNIEDGEEDTFGESFTDRENENAKGKKVTEEMLQGLVVESKRLCEAYLDSSHQVQLLKNQVVKKEQDEQERLRENTATIAQIKSILESLIECEGSVGEQAVHLLHHVNHFIL